MDSTRKLESLPESILIFIISLLPFKESARTCVLSKRWRYLYYERTSLIFKESEFTKQPNFERETVETDRFLFVQVIREWISNFTNKVIENFELYLSQPMDFHEDIIFLIEFAASQQVKNLVLDFSNPIQNRTTELDHTFKALHLQKNEFDISRLFFNLLYVRNLTVCSFLLQMLQDCDDPMALHDSMKTKHLVMKTNLHANDFVGIGTFLNSCPELESLTFDMVTTNCFVRAPWRLVIDPGTYWLTRKAYKCVEERLKVVKVKNFCGSSNELHVIEYLMRNGRVMERLDLYEAKGLNHYQKMWVMAGVEEIQQNLKRASKHLRITLHNA